MFVGGLTLVHCSVSLLRSEYDYFVIKHLVIGRREIWGERGLNWHPRGETWVCHTTIQKSGVGRIFLMFLKDAYFAHQGCIFLKKNTPIL